MRKILKTRYANPLEREYEGWIVAGIESYLSRIGIPFAIWAVSPDQEKHWPADESLFLEAKVIGLQFKQAKIATGPLHSDRLHWTFHKPPAQFGLVKANPEVFYCLPTFINRDFRSEALHHCLFWRPDDGAPDNKNAWYDNDEAATPYKNLECSRRWGLFVEGILRCNLGKRVISAGEAADVQGRILSHISEALLREPEAVDGANAYGGLYMLAVSLKS